MSIDIHGEIKMISNCDVTDELDDKRSIASMKLMSSLDNMSGNKHFRMGSEELFSVTENKENNKEEQQTSYSTLPLRKHHSVTGPLLSNSPLRPNKRVHSVEIPVQAFPDNTDPYHTDLEKGVAKLRVTPDEAREIMQFINDKIASRTSLHNPELDMRPSTQVYAVPVKTNAQGMLKTKEEAVQRIKSEATKSDDEIAFGGEGVDEAQEGGNEEEAVFGGRRVHKGFNSLPLLHRSGDVAVQQIEDIPSKECEVEEIQPEYTKPKQSFLSKLKKSFKLYSNEDKRATNFPQLARPPSTYIGSEHSLNASEPSNHTDRNSEGGAPEQYIGEQYVLPTPPSFHGNRHQTLHDSPQSFQGNRYQRNSPPDYVSGDGEENSSPHRAMEGRATQRAEKLTRDSEHQLPNRFEDTEEPPQNGAASRSNSEDRETKESGRSRSAKRVDKRKGRSRSRSISKFFGNMARKAKSLTEVRSRPHSPPWYGNDYDPVRDTDAHSKPSPQPHYTQHDRQPIDSPQTQMGSPPIPRHSKPAAKSPEKKRRSLAGKIRRKLSVGKGDKMANAERTKEFSKSTPVLVKEPPLTPAALPKQIKRAKSSEHMSTSSSLRSTTDVRTQIVLKSAKINKGCKCQVCSLVRKNIRSHCETKDPASHHKYEVVLKMNLLGADFMNSECGSVASCHESCHEDDIAVEADKESTSHQIPDNHEHQVHSDNPTHHNQTGEERCWNDAQSVSSRDSQDSTLDYQQLRHALSQARISVV